MKAVLSVSGGLDSVTMLAQQIQMGNDVFPVHFQYGSKHNPYELSAFNRILQHYGLFHHGQFAVISLIHVFEQIKSDLLETGGAIPEGHYEEDSMRRTVVPGRNTIFSSILYGIAESRGFDTVLLGIHAGDHHIYPDCRPEFLNAMNSTVLAASEAKVNIKAPFLGMNKAQILSRGLYLNVPYAFTRTCYKDQRTACGKCGSCQERLWAFEQNTREDPIEYETRELIPKKA